MPKLAQKWLKNALEQADLIQGFIDIVVDHIEEDLDANEKQAVLDLIRRDHKFKTNGLEQDAALLIIQRLLEDALYG